MLKCQASTKGLSVSCDDVSAAPVGRGAVNFGGQNQWVQVATSGVAYDSIQGRFTFNTVVKNFTSQEWGRKPDSTVSTSGVQVFFQTGPSVSSGTGSITVVGDGTATFTAPNQPYYQYSGTMLGSDSVLSLTEATSSKQWRLDMPKTVLTFTFSLLISTEVQFPNGFILIQPDAITIIAGGAANVDAFGFTKEGQFKSDSITWASSDSTIAIVTPTSKSSASVSAVAPGLATITATQGALTKNATITVCPNLSGATGLTYTVTNSSFCLSGGGSQYEYTIVPVRTASTNLSYSITGSGIASVAGPPNPDMIPSGNIQVPFDGGSTRLAVRTGPKPDEDAHIKFLRRSTDAVRRFTARDLVQPLLRDPRIKAAIVPGVPAVGAKMTLNVNATGDPCTALTSHTAFIKSVGTHIIMAEDSTNPSGGFSTAQYDSLAATFDTLVWPAVAGNFGAPFDIDTNGRVIALYTAAVNDLTPPASSSYIGGFFYSRDLFSTGSCAGSNQGEMFYMLAPDPTGVHNNVRSAAFVKSVTIGTLGHEFQHLINASRRKYGAGGPYPFEQVWLNEGLSHIAEEEVYYASSVHGPGENVGITAITANQAQTDRFFQFAEPNFGRLRQWLLSPHSVGPFTNADNLAIRGSAWAFLRYAADRKGGLESDLWSGLAFSPDTGLTNLNNRLGTDSQPWFRDFSMAMYADDAGLTSVQNVFKQPSWNFRELYASLDYDPGPSCSCAYQLMTRLPANNTLLNFTLTGGGGSAYIRVGVPASTNATFTTTAPASGLRLLVIRTK